MLPLSIYVYYVYIKR